MGKEKQEQVNNNNKSKNNQQVQQVQQEQKPIQNKKKIIKKVLFKGNKDKDKQDQLKDWKPVKIQKKVNINTPSATKQQNLAQSFLSSLSKPIHKSQNKKPTFFDDDQPIKITPKPVLNIKKLTPQQIKWDIEDQTFIRKQFIPNQKIEHQLQQQPIQQEQQIVVLPSAVNKQTKNMPTKIKHIDLSKIVNQNWKQAAIRKQTKNQLWEGAQGLLDGRGSLAKLAKQAQQRAQQIQSQINKRSYQKKQMKSRYGW